MAGFMCSEGFFSLYYIIVNIMQVQEARLQERLTCKADLILDSGALSGWRRIPSIALSMGK